MNLLLDTKEKIKTNFSDSVHYYAQHADAQKQIAERLSKALKPWQYSLPEGPVLEIGAGTGFFTGHLLEMFKDREKLISDVSKEMIDYCREKFGSQDLLKYRTIDAEETDWPEKKFALIAGNYVAQWFKHPSKTLSALAASLKPGGLMLISFPAKESFSNWKNYCLDLGLPFTANNLPDIEQVVIDLSMGPVKVDFYEDDVIVTFENVFDFFRHLKQTGTATNIGEKQLSVKQLRLLNDYWLEQDGGKVKVRYHTGFIAVKREMES